ncbi:ribonuclease HII [Jeotgalibaca arthritidis]|uniref:Ribonuclease HII n=1 Tax=Jeotgalibaca arthritidis TaxID=1868794 RepID=A0A6G7KCC2_9LACT|nr:ribonuclease HII [Jeotgalibaca arthritidis]QII82872.1 ribonuclease HII [Jeotgalibaca arthritidis]
MEKRPTIQALKEQLLQITDPSDERLLAIAKDERKGIQTALKQWHSRYEKGQQLLTHREKMLTYERQLMTEGYHIIAGIDEVGRGPLAGPIVAAAVILPSDMPALPINDSKKLSESNRNLLSKEIWECAKVGIGVVDNQQIDELNIYQATKLAMKQAVGALGIQPDALLIDAMTLDLPFKQESLIKGDTKSYSIAAASIVAKVYRDSLMKDYAKVYPHYGFEKNAGYGTKTHLEGLDQYGVTPIHRRSFEPIKSMTQKMK